MDKRIKDATFVFAGTLAPGDHILVNAERTTPPSGRLTYLQEFEVRDTFIDETKGSAVAILLRTVTASPLYAVMAGDKTDIVVLCDEEGGR